MKKKIDTLSDSLIALKEFMMTKLPSESTQRQEKELVTKKSSGKQGKTDLNESISETTIYHNVLEKVVEEQVDPEITFCTKPGKRDSSSSEDRVDTSDDMIDMEVDINPCFIADCTADIDRCKRSFPEQERRPVRPSEAMIRGSETRKERLEPTSGNVQVPFNTPLNNCGKRSTDVDENYVVVGAHIEPSLKDKIRRSEYVEFARLLPRKKINYDDNCMELVNRGGQTFFVPVSDKDSNSISSFTRWEQAFHVFSSEYLNWFPDRATELVQYNHVIYTALLSFSWDNVYAYDREFRMHLSNFPDRSWSVILQQAWSICLKDKINGNGNFTQGNNKGQFKTKKEGCKRFN